MSHEIVIAILISVIALISYVFYASSVVKVKKIFGIFVLSTFMVISAGFIIFVFILLLAEDEPRKPPPSKAELELIAHDVYAVIAGQTFRVPLVAIYGVERSGSLCSEKDSANCMVSKEKILANQPIEFKHIRISLQHYSSYFDGDLYTYDYPELCPILSQEWARHICTERNNRGFFGLERFSLVEKKSLSSFNDTWLSGYGESLGELVKKMTFEGETPSIYCDYDEQGNPMTLCAAGMQVSDRLLAAWVVSRREADIPTIARDGQIIKTLLKYGMRETENFEELNSALQE